LLDENWNVKLSDFGLSQCIEENHNVLKNEHNNLCTTYAYTAPEIFSSQSFSIKSDVYSIGIVMWELVSRFVEGVYVKPFEEYSFDYQILMNVVQNTKRPTIPDKWPPILKELIQKCWSQDPHPRPTAAQLLEFLKNNNLSEIKF